MSKQNKIKVKGVSGCPLFWRRFKGRRDWKRGIALAENGQAGHYILQLLAACHTHVAKVYRRLEQDTAELHCRSSQLVQEYYGKQQQLAVLSGVEAGGATRNIRARNASYHAACRAELLSAFAGIKSQLVSIDEELLHAENAAAADCRQAALLTEKHIRAYLHGASRAAACPVQAAYQLPPAFDHAADFAARHRAATELRRAILAAEPERSEAE